MIACEVTHDARRDHEAAHLRALHSSLTPRRLPCNEGASETVVAPMPGGSSARVWVCPFHAKFIREQVGDVAPRARPVVVPGLVADTPVRRVPACVSVPQPEVITMPPKLDRDADLLHASLCRRFRHPENGASGLSKAQLIQESSLSLNELEKAMGVLLRDKRAWAEGNSSTRRFFPGDVTPAQLVDLAARRHTEQQEAPTVAASVTASALPPGHHRIPAPMDRRDARTTIEAGAAIGEDRSITHLGKIHSATVVHAGRVHPVAEVVLAAAGLPSYADVTAENEALKAKLDAAIEDNRALRVGNPNPSVAGLEAQIEVLREDVANARRKAQTLADERPELLRDRQELIELRGQIDRFLTDMMNDAEKANPNTLRAIGTEALHGEGSVKALELLVHLVRDGLADARLATPLTLDEADLRERAHWLAESDRLEREAAEAEASITQKRAVAADARRAALSTHSSATPSN